MGINRPPPKLNPGEVRRWIGLANHQRGLSATSGQLVVTDERILFDPSRLDKLIGYRRWQCPIGAVRGIEDVDPQAVELFAGGLRRRLGLRLDDGLQVFVVNHLDRTISELSQILGLPIARRE